MVGIALYAAMNSIITASDVPFGSASNHLF
jgi:hypothetical protein